MGVEILTDKDMQLPDAHPKTKGPEWLVERREDLNCLHCGTIWEPDEKAAMTIQIRGITVIGEIIITCPKCSNKSVLCPEGGNDTHTEGSTLAISPPKKGYFLRQLDEAAMTKEEWRAQWRREAEEDKKREAMNPTTESKRPKPQSQNRPSCNGQVPRQKYGGAKTK